MGRKYRKGLPACRALLAMVFLFLDVLAFSQAYGFGAFMGRIICSPTSCSPLARWGSLDFYDSLLILFLFFLFLLLLCRSSTTASASLCAGSYSNRKKLSDQPGQTDADPIGPWPEPHHELQISDQSGYAWIRTHFRYKIGKSVNKNFRQNNA